MTDKTSLRRRAARAAFPLYITAATVFLALQMFQGLSFLDIGMYLAGCRWFNEDPWSCYYLGQWFLSYKLTGALLHACGDSSFMALRVMALALNIVTQTAIYLYTSRLVPRRYAIAGLAMTGTGIAGLITGTTVYCVYKKRLNNMVDSCNSASHLNVSLGMQQHGVGLAVNF